MVAALKPPPLIFDPDAPSVGTGLFGLPFTVEESRVVVIPVPYDATTSGKPGAAKAPAAMLRASQQGDLHSYEVGDPYEFGIAMQPIPTFISRLNDDVKLRASVNRANDAAEKINRFVFDQTAELLRGGKLPVVLGGEHSVPFGAISAAAAKHPMLGVLQLDAHMDLRQAYEGYIYSHASIAYNVITRISAVSKLVQFGVRDFGKAEEQFAKDNQHRITTFYDRDMARRKFEGQRFTSIADDIVSPLPSTVWLTFDVDGLDPSLAPHTGTPVPGGVSWNETIEILHRLPQSGPRIIGMDLCEVAPWSSAENDWDATVGQELLYQMIGFALMGV